MRHAVDGYRFLATLGYEDAARINMTHSFAVKDLRAIFGEWDCTADEMRFIEAYLAGIEYDDYDRLIQLCDSLAMADGFVLMEKRMLDVAMRYGNVNDIILAKWRAKFVIKADFERRMGCSVYSLLPGVVENTFGSFCKPGLCETSFAETWFVARLVVGWEELMRVFIGGVMQASNHGKGLVDQTYRNVLADALSARWPELEVIDPLRLHPDSVEYGDALAKDTLLALLDLASASDLVVAYLPVASMGTALEMYSAHQHGVPVVTISPLAENWVVRAFSQRVFPDLDSFMAALQAAGSPLDLTGLS